MSSSTMKKSVIVRSLPIGVVGIGSGPGGAVGRGTRTAPSESSGGFDGDEAEGSAADDEDVGSPAHPERATGRARAVSTPPFPGTVMTRRCTGRARGRNGSSWTPRAHPGGP